MAQTPTTKGYTTCSTIFWSISLFTCVYEYKLNILGRVNGVIIHRENWEIANLVVEHSAVCMYVCWPVCRRKSRKAMATLSSCWGKINSIFTRGQRYGAMRCWSEPRSRDVAATSYTRSITWNRNPSEYHFPAERCGCTIHSHSHTYNTRLHTYIIFHTL